MVYLWYNDEGTGRDRSPPRPLLTVPNVTAHPSTANVPTSYYSMWGLQLPLESVNMNAYCSEGTKYLITYTKRLCIFGPKGAIQIRYYYYYYYYYTIHQPNFSLNDY